MTDLKKKLMDKWVLGTLEIDDVAALADILVQQREALEFECGKRCAQQNPCSAREALAATDEVLKGLGIEV